MNLFLFVYVFFFFSLFFFFFFFFWGGGGGRGLECTTLLTEIIIMGSKCKYHSYVYIVYFFNHFEVSIIVYHVFHMFWGFFSNICIYLNIQDNTLDVSLVRKNGFCATMALGGGICVPLTYF